MGRAQRKTPHRDPGDWVANLVADLIPGAQLDGQDAGQLREEGIGEPRDIPGGKNHQANPATRAEPGVKKEAAWRYSRADLAHGVPPDEAGYYERDPRLSNRQEGGAGHLHHEADLPSPVPVYIVPSAAAGARPDERGGFRRITLPAAGSEPVELVGADPHRSIVQLLNEDATHNGRIGNLEDLTYDAQNGVITGGARLPSGATGYLTISIREPVYGVSETSSAVVVSMITEFGSPGAG